MYAHLVHIDGEAGAVDYEAVLGPFEGFCLTYGQLRETNEGRTVATLHSSSGYWYISVGGEELRGYSDIAFVEEYPESLVG